MASSRYKPGQSGNPKGRKKGSLNKRTQLIQALESDLPELIEATKQKALKGDTAALRLLIERLIPAKKSEASLVSIPELGRAKSLTEKAVGIVDAVGNGQIPADTGATLITALGGVARIIEVDELTKRIEVLEDAKEQS